MSQDSLPHTSFTWPSPGTSLRPFYFYPLSSGTSSKREDSVPLDLISKLPTSLTQAAAAEDRPDWLAKLVVDKGAASAWKVMEKKISGSDASEPHNRLMISKQVIQERIKPVMTIEEIEAANLTNTRRIRGGEGQPVGRKRGRVHEGLEVMVYNKSGQGCLLYLTRWDSIESTVLKGPNYKDLRRYFASGDLVEMWAFRDGAEKLCFVIEKKPS